MSSLENKKRGVNESNQHMTDIERYNAGYDHGYRDQQLNEFKRMYIFGGGTGFGEHTDYFNLGWTHGFMGMSRAKNIRILVEF